MWFAVPIWSTVGPCYVAITMKYLDVYYIEQNSLFVYNKIMEYEITIYATENGTEPFSEWLNSLKDFDTQALIFQRL